MFGSAFQENVVDFIDLLATFAPSNPITGSKATKPVRKRQEDKERREEDECGTNPHPSCCLRINGSRIGWLTEALQKPGIICSIQLCANWHQGVGMMSLQFLFTVQPPPIRLSPIIIAGYLRPPPHQPLLYQKTQSDIVLCRVGGSTHVMFKGGGEWLSFIRGRPFARQLPSAPTSDTDPAAARYAASDHLTALIPVADTGSRCAAVLQTSAPGCFQSSQQQQNAAPAGQARRLLARVCTWERRPLQHEQEGSGSQLDFPAAVSLVLLPNPTGITFQTGELELAQTVTQESGQKAWTMITHVIVGNECEIDRDLLSLKWDFKVLIVWGQLSQRRARHLTSASQKLYMSVSQSDRHACEGAAQAPVLSLLNQSLHTIFVRDYKCHVGLCALKNRPQGPICPATGGDRVVSALLDAREGETDSVMCRELIVARKVVGSGTFEAAVAFREGLNVIDLSSESAKTLGIITTAGYAIQMGATDPVLIESL
ncbi:hypothetical protein FQN60_014551 [Etheostoma spectabile]|uniref:Uncharacterized protein n=1 Tax=Etheostoma spectabile TaxID=54343 RepID=A0A5J5D921_9PERO|nr:hypothetical protein FQN60_014551 [Etheostoma spectabile]